MAIGGRKPKPPDLKLVTGNPGHRPIPGVDQQAPPEIQVRDEPLDPPKKLTKMQQVLWDRFINKAWWLTDHDVPKAYAWVCLESEFEKAPVKMVAARFGQLRILGSELGLDPMARARMGTAGGQKKADQTEKFFD
jgi:phage terminase small subunit